MSWKDIIKRMGRQVENFARDQLENMRAERKPQEQSGRETDLKTIRFKIMSLKNCVPCKHYFIQLSSFWKFKYYYYHHHCFSCSDSKASLDVEIP